MLGLAISVATQNTLAESTDLAESGAAAIAQSDPGSAAASYFAELPLVDQNGRQLDLYRDVMKDHSVVIHSFFSRCGASCPVMMSTLQGVQQRLGDRMDRQVRLVSISVDPAHDTPEVLAEFAQRVQAQPGWLFLTGSSEQVAAALLRIGQQVAEPSAHMDLLVAGNTNTGLWKKLHALAPAPEIVELVMEVVDDPGE